MVTYRGRRNPEEHAQLLALVTTGRAAAVKLLHARIFLKADGGADNRCWTDAAMAAALDTSAATIQRVRQAFVEQGLEAALSRQRPPGRPYRKLDGAQEAQLIAVACSAPPAGRARWTLRLLADTLVALNLVATISPECVRTTLKQTCSNHGSRSHG
jgi:transposase